MKKQLLATTALVAASLMVTGDALAQAAPITLGVHGYWRMFANFNSSPGNDNMVLAPALGAGTTTYTGTTGTPNTRGHVLPYQNDIESRLFFTGSGKLDNGIEPGVVIQYETFSRVINNTNGTFSGTAPSVARTERRSKGYFKGAFGEVAMGDWDNIGRPRAVYQAAIDLLGADSPSGTYPLGTNNTVPDPASASTRIMYISPAFAGFDFGFSFAPSQTSGRTSSAGSVAFDSDGVPGGRSGMSWRGNLKNIWTPVVRYNGTFGGFGVGGDVSYVGSDNNCSGRTTPGIPNFNVACVGQDSRVTTYRGSAQVTYAGFKLGLAYAKENNVFGNSQNTTVWAPGLDYTTGPWTFGVYYSTGDYDQLRAPLSATGAALGPATKVTDTLNFYNADVLYKIGPGINLQAGVTYERYKYGGNAQYRNASDFGFTTIGSQSAWVFNAGVGFSY